MLIIVFLTFWNLLDYPYSTFITRSAYQFAVGSDMSLPVMVALIIGYIVFLRKKTD